MNQADTVELRIAKLLKEEMAIDVPSLKTDLIEGGYIDSLLLAEILERIEREFMFRVRIEELDLEELRTIVGFAGFVERQLVHRVSERVRDGKSATAD